MINLSRYLLFSLLLYYHQFYSFMYNVLTKEYVICVFYFGIFCKKIDIIIKKIYNVIIKWKSIDDLMK